MRVLLALCALAVALCGGGPEVVRPASVPPALLIQDVSVLDTGVVPRRTAEKLGGEIRANYISYRRNFRGPAR